MNLSVKKQIPVFILIGINLTVFILCLFGVNKYDYMMNAVTVCLDHQYWRVLASMFMHADIRHLAFNMISLYGLSALVLETQPVWKYEVMYFGSGILGGLADAYLRLRMGDLTYCLGASGAIMGLLGANIAFYIKNRHAFAKPALKSQLIRLGIFAAINLIPENSSVDYYGHLWGMIAGFVLGMIFIRKEA